jgi:methionine-rich copper-binding protein CopC
MAWLRHLLRGSVLLSALLTVLVVSQAAAASTADSVPGSDQGSTELLWSWPNQGASLWVPAREGRLVFSAPVRSSTVTASIQTSEGQPVEELTRITRGESVEMVLFRFPDLAEGRYLFSWSALDVRDEGLAGSVRFSVPERFTAPGGGNHRHQAAHLYRDSLGELTLRTMLVVSAALSILVAPVARPRRLWLAVVSRVAALLTVVASLIWVVADLVHQVVENPSQPVLAVFASPRPWMLLPLAAASVLQLIVGRHGRPAAWFAGGTVIAAAAVSHPGGEAVPWSQVPFMVALLGSVAFAFALLGQSLLIDRPSARVARAVVFAAVAGVSSIALLLVRTRSLEMRGLFIGDAQLRLTAAAAALLLLPAAVAGFGRAGLTRVGGMLLAGAAAVALVFLLRIPPPAVGL